MKKFLVMAFIVLIALSLSGCTMPGGLIPTSSVNPTATPTANPTQAPTTAPTNVPASSPTVKASVSPDASVVPTPTAQAGIPGTGFAGMWKTDYGTMTIIVVGNKATGTYEHSEGQIEGTITGKVLNGTWTELSTRSPPDDAGDIMLTLSDNGSSFTGSWRYGMSDDAAADWSGGWSGIRIG